jgi:DNA replicative helicase MCM subunit Mcm2 (Cdc46/Mcm family)
MKSVKETTKKYNELIKDVETNDFYKTDLTNKVNCYVCKCGHVTKTIDIHSGVTPFMFTCEKCDGDAQSTFYNDIKPYQKPTFEWHRPILKEVLKMRKDEFILDHVLRGGLIDRKIKT